LLLLGVLLFGSRAGAAALFTNGMILPGGTLQVQLMCEQGQNYTIEVSTNLSDWVAVGAIEQAPTNLLTLDDPDPVQPGGKRFYRARLGISPKYGFWLMHQTEGGHFGSALTPTPGYPVSMTAYTAVFEVEYGAPYPPTSQVLFTGPAGSGLSSLPADPNNVFIADSKGTYQSPRISNPPTAPGGAYTVSYQGSNHVFNLPAPQAASRLVLPVPTVTLEGSVIKSVSWSYRSPATGAPVGVPSFMRGIQVQIEGFVGGRIYDMPWSDNPASTSHQLLQTVIWSDVSVLNMAYDDDLGNHYVIFYHRP
jgi:hypothetical protein